MKERGTGRDENDGKRKFTDKQMGVIAHNIALHECIDIIEDSSKQHLVTVEHRVANYINAYNKAISEIEKYNQTGEVDS